MTDLRTPLTRAEVTEIRDEAIERPRLAHGSMKVRDLADTALHYEHWSGVYRAEGDEFRRQRDTADARIHAVEEGLRAMVRAHDDLFDGDDGFYCAEPDCACQEPSFKNARALLGEPQEDNP